MPAVPDVYATSLFQAAFTVAVGATETFTVQYTPTAIGAFSFDLNITNNDADESNYVVTVSGTVLAEILFEDSFENPPEP